MPCVTGPARRAAAVVAGFVCLVPGASAQVQEILVTARKKEESLQDVPISVTAFGEEQLRALGIADDDDVADFTVNFNTLPQTGRDYDRPVIRGMSAPPSRGEANAGYFIDGIYVSGSIAAATTSAVERVEILRGPQATQFGRATFSGAINYVTRRPTDTLEGEVNTRAGTHDDYMVGGVASGPLIGDKLHFLVSGNWSRYGGEWNNALQADQAFAQPDVTLLQAGTEPQQADHSRLGAEETQDYLVKLLWEPWEGAELNLKYGYTETDDSMFPSLVAPAGAPLGALPPGDPRLGLAAEHGGPVGIFATLDCALAPPEFYSYLYAGNRDPYPGEQSWWRTSGGALCGEVTAGDWENRVNVPDFESGVTISNGRRLQGVEPGMRKHQNRYFLQYTQQLSEWLLTARGGINTEEFHNAFDLDHTEARAVFGLFNFDIDRRNKDWSGELRLASPRDRSVRGELGAYYFDRHVTQTSRSLPGPTLFFGSTDPDVLPEFPPRSERDVENIAWFGALGWDLAERWTIDLEARYASEEVAYLGGNRCESAATYYNFTPRVSLTFSPTEVLRFYAQVANGDKPGDVNTEYFRGDVDRRFCELALANTSDVLIQPEEAWNYEIGMKSQWLDRRIQANLAVFLIDWSEQSIFQTVNFASYQFPDYANGQTLVTTILRNVGDSRNIGGELETLFAVTDELTLVANYGYTHAKFRKGFDSNLQDLTGNGNVDGKWIPSAPEHNAVLGLILAKPMSADATATLRWDLAYEGKRYISTSNYNYIGERVLVNLRAGVRTGPWNVTAYVRNLMDDETPVAALSFVNFGYGALAPGIDAVYGTNDDVYPNMTSINPQRGRDYGLELSYRFGGQ